MADIVYLVTIVIAFAGLAGLLRVCDRVIGPGPAGAGADRQPAGERADG
jgi:hypothetical protein